MIMIQSNALRNQGSGRQENKIRSYIPSTNSYISETQNQYQSRVTMVNGVARRMEQAGDIAGAIAYRRGQGFPGYEAQRLPDLSGSQKYIGYDYRGQPLTQSNLKQFFEDHALYSKVQAGLVPEANAGANDLEKSWSREDYLRARGITFNPIHWNPDTGFNNQLLKIINYQNPEIATNPDLLAQIANQNPKFLSDSWEWMNSNSQTAYKKEQAKDKGGFGVIAEGLGQVAQFAGLAAGLHGLTAGLGALTSGAGLQGAFNAGMSAAGGMTDFGGVVGNIVGNPAIGNIANVGQAALTGGYEGGVPGALIGAGGAAIGAGVGEAGGIEEFLADPLGSIGSAFNVAAGGGVGGLLNTDNAMANAAQVGPGSLASNTPPVTGPIADEVITVTATAPGSTGNYGWLASTLTGLGVPSGASLDIGPTGNLQGYSFTRPDGAEEVIGFRNDVPPDLVNGQPTSTTQPSGSDTAGAIAGAITGGAGTGSAQTGAGSVGTTTGAGVAGETAGTGTGGLLDTTPTTPVTPGPITVGSPEWWDQVYAQSAATPNLTPTPTLTPPPTSSWATAGQGPVQEFGTPQQPAVGSPEYINQAILAAMAGGSAFPESAGPSIPSWVTAGQGQVSNFPGAGTGTPGTPAAGSEGGLSDAELAALLTGGAVGVGLGLGGADGMATATGFGDGAGTGTGTGVGTGTGQGTGQGTGDGTGAGSGLDLLFPQMQGLLETGFQPGTEADFGQYGPVGSIIKAGKSNIPQTPKRKKRGIRVNISGRARNA